MLLQSCTPSFGLMLKRCVNFLFSELHHSNNQYYGSYSIHL
nr:MAG TPA: hypothetical protein [Microviridae sp.]